MSRSPSGDRAEELTRPGRLEGRRACNCVTIRKFYAPEIAREHAQAERQAAEPLRSLNVP
jgi:hypothetical protein